MTTLKQPTEQRNRATVDIDLAPTSEMITSILNEDAVAVAVTIAVAPALARVVDEARARMERGARLHYFGAGASGRLAVLDATELTPTFGLERGKAIAHFPGGSAALVDSTIDLEDGEELGQSDAGTLSPGDIAIGVTASGTTPYVAGALRRARERGAYTALITCNPSSGLANLADDIVVLDTGAEALTGSTRLKAGTATKIALNAFSTALMIGLGHSYSNLMVGMSVTNTKLSERAIDLLREATGLGEEECRTAFAAADFSIPRALVTLLAGVDAGTARTLLAEHGSVRNALAARAAG